MSSSPGEPPEAGYQPMRPRVSASARVLTAFFSQALTSFKATSSKLEVICTASRQPVGTSQKDDQPAIPSPLPPRARPRTLIILDSSFNPPTRAHLRMATSAILSEGRPPTTTNHNVENAVDVGGRAETTRLLLLLSINNADKAPKPAPFHQRLGLMWAFAQDVQAWLQQQANTAIDVDIGLSTLPFFHEKSEAIDQVGFYQRGAPEVKMGQVMLVGYDTLIRVFNPKYYGPVAAPPPGTPLDTSVPTAAENKQEKPRTPMQKALGPLFQRARLRVTMRTDDEWGGKDEQLKYLQDLVQDDDGEEGGGHGLGRISGSKEWAERIEMVEGREAGTEVVSSTYARDAAREGNRERLDKMVSDGVKWWIEEEGLYRE
ncbi:hypothetical protein QC764_611810 [Podospora pseudoanserina]|uniref:Nicotinamide-nucleotide adenylyltransferase n=1 Tax=Podospora pseudoanserina TaxID=2609844 RepID=A0ABR0HSE0_9PEZI|nr:hypothetical protein QC764_611810 [Podospora pseudoanserina]